MTCGVYVLLFENTDKVYVGQSINIEKRFLEHKSSLITTTASKKLQNAYEVFGMPKVEILLECGSSDLNAKELECIKEFDSVNNGFNSIIVTNGGSNLCGEQSYAAKHSNAQYEQAFFTLLNNPNLSYKEVSNLCNIPTTVLTQMVTGNSHLWLKDKYPKEYEKLKQVSKYKNAHRAEFKIKPSTTSTLDKTAVINALKYLVSDPKLSHTKISELTNIKISTIRDISSMRRHTWLANTCPVEYEKLKQIKGK
jgi:hypothetical protein